MAVIVIETTLFINNLDAEFTAILDEDEDIFDDFPGFPGGQDNIP